MKYEEYKTIQQTKIFSTTNRKSVDELINNWLDKYPNIKIINIIYIYIL